MYLQAFLLIAVSCYAFKSRSLSVPGIAIAFLIGIIHLSHKSLMPFISLLTFFLAGNFATKYKKDIKYDARAKCTTRNIRQILANSIVPTLLISIDILSEQQSPQRYDLFSESHRLHTALMLGVATSYATVLGDTLSSELGSLSSKTPILVTTMEPVLKGTNGAVTMDGFKAAAFGGFLIGVCLQTMPWVSHFQRLIAIILATSWGLFGSLTDSFLGAKFQETIIDVKRNIVIEHVAPSDVANVKRLGLPIFSNDQVNLVSSALMGLATLAAFLV